MMTKIMVNDDDDDDGNYSHIDYNEDAADSFFCLLTAVNCGFKSNIIMDG